MLKPVFIMLCVSLAAALAGSGFRRGMCRFAGVGLPGGDALRSTLAAAALGLARGPLHRRRPRPGSLAPGAFQTDSSVGWAICPPFR